MDAPRFDRLARSVASAPSRRRVLAGLAGGLLALGGRDALADACKADGKACKKGGQCCSGNCTPEPTGQTSTAHSGGICCPAGQVQGPGGACCAPAVCQEGQCGAQPAGCGLPALDCGACACPAGAMACDGQCWCGCQFATDCAQCVAQGRVCPTRSSCVAIGAFVTVCFAEACTPALAGQFVACPGPEGQICACGTSTEGAPVCVDAGGLCAGGGHACQDSGQCAGGELCVVGGSTPCIFNSCLRAC